MLLKVLQVLILLKFQILLTLINKFKIENLQLKKRKVLLTESTGFKFFTILVLVLKKVESEDKSKYGAFY